MKGFQLLPGVILIAFGLFSLQTQLVLAVYTMNETCMYVTKTWIANPDLCQGWGYCDGGKLVGTGTCGAGLLFNSKTGDCDYADQVTCASTVADICKNMQTPQMVADPNNCNNFCYCDGNGSFECAQCPQNQLYDPTKQACVWGKDYPNCPADSICRSVPNNVFVADPNHCGNFMSCVDGSGTSTSCANSQYFNPINGMCQNLNPCSGDNDNSGTNTDTSGPGVSTPLPPGNYSDFCSNVVGPTFVPDTKTCMGYYYCPAVTTEKPAPLTVDWSKCPLGTHFNPTTKKCVTPYTFSCKHDRCGNINQAFVTMVDATFNAATACQSYINCKSQTALKNNAGGFEYGTCPSDYQYFDEVIGSCVNVKPGYEICTGA